MSRPGDGSQSQYFNQFGMASGEIQRVDTPRIHQGFSRIGVDVVPFFTTSASDSLLQPPAARTASRQPRAAQPAAQIASAGTQQFPYSRHPLPHHRQTTIAIEMESSSGKLPQTPRCLSC